MRSLPVLLLAAAGIVSCSEDDSLPVFGEPVWDGEHLQVWATEDARICGGSFQALDHHAQQLSNYASEFGITSTAERYRYYWTSVEEFQDAPCFGSACNREAAIYAPRYSPHEVVHAEFASEHSSFADEGLAVMLGDFGINEFGEPIDTETIPHIIDETQGSSLRNEHYNSAGKFVGAMRELYPEEYLPPLLDTQRSDDFERFSTTINSSGIDLDAVIAFNQTENECRLGAYRLAVSECNIPPSPWDNEDEWTASGTIDCASEDTSGPDGGGAIWTIRSFDIIEPGTYTVTAETDGFGLLSACDTPWCGSAFTGSFKPPGWMLLVSTIPGTVEMQPGRYWIRVQQDIDDDPAPFSLSVVRNRDD